MKTFSIGIDIGGTNTLLGLVDNEGRIYEKLSFSTKEFSIAEQYLEKLCQNIISLIDRCQDKENICGIGTGTPNGNYYNGTIEYAPNLNFKGIVPVKSFIENYLQQKGYNLKVTVTNDANAAALGEKQYGGAKDCDDFVMITLGTGVGSGIVVNGKLVYGHDGFAGEVGHTTVIPDGRLCGCGRKGCVETYSSATGIKQTCLELLEQEKYTVSNKKSVLSRLSKEEITAKSIYEAALEGDLIALKCFDVTAKVLAIGIANCVAVTSPKKIFLFGGLAQSGEILLRPLRKYMEENLYIVFQNKIEMCLSQLPEADAAILGAASMAY
jgi:glucokinase